MINYKRNNELMKHYCKETTTSVNVGSGVDVALGDPSSKPKKNKPNYYANGLKQCPKCKGLLNGDDTYRLKTHGKCVCSKCKFMINRDYYEQ